MNITKTLNEKDMTMTLEGKVDVLTAPEFKQAVEEIINEIDSLTLDMEQVSYMSSAGLRVILTAFNTLSKRGGLKILHANEQVVDALTVTGMTDFITLE